MNPTRVTAQQVAGEASVSVSAVYNWSSRPHLNSAAQNERIEAAARKLGYRVRSRQPATTGPRVGVEVHRTPDNASSGIYASLLVAVMEDLHERGGRLVPFITRGDPVQRTEAYQGAWNRSDVDGFLVDTVPPDGGEPLSTLDALRAPYVLFGRPPAMSARRPPVAYSWVDVDNKQGMRAATEHLLRQGHERVAYLGPEPDVDHVSRERWQGYEEALQLAGQETRRIDASYDETLSTLRPRLEALVDGDVTAVACFSDDLAVELMRFMAAETNAPRTATSARRLAIVGFDNSEKARLGLTSVRQPVEEIARHLVIGLQEKIRRSDLSHNVVLPCDLVVRDSSGSL